MREYKFKVKIGRFTRLAIVGGAEEIWGYYWYNYLFPPISWHTNLKAPFASMTLRVYKVFFILSNSTDY